MKLLLFIASALITSIALFAFRFETKQKQVLTSFNVTEFKKKNIIRCSPDWDEIKDWLEETNIPPIPRRRDL